MQFTPEKDKTSLTILPLETSLIDIKTLIDDWEKNADKFKIDPPGEYICPESPGVK